MAQSRSRSAPASVKWGGISSVAVEKATGRSWKKWITALDRAGCAAMTHAQIAAHIHRAFGTSGWWSQMVTVGYEQAKGLRNPHEKPDGYSASITRTLPVAPTRVTTAFSSAAARAKWLPGTPLEIRTTHAGKSVRAWWKGAGAGNGTSIVVATVTAKGPGKCSVQVNHDRLRGPRDVTKSKAFWAAALDRLRDDLAR